MIAPIQSGNNATINIVVIIWNTGTSITLCNKTNNVTGIMIGAKIDVNKVNKTVKDRFALDNSAIRLDAVPPGQQPTITRPINAYFDKPNNFPITKANNDTKINLIKIATKILYLNFLISLNSSYLTFIPTINMINAKSHTRVGFRSVKKLGKSKPSKTAKIIENTKIFF